MIKLRKCKWCNGKIDYSERFDAYFCNKCNQWLEVACGDPWCPYCPNRPEKPNEPKP